MELPFFDGPSGCDCRVVRPVPACSYDLAAVSTCLVDVTDDVRIAAAFGPLLDHIVVRIDRMRLSRVSLDPNSDGEVVVGAEVGAVVVGNRGVG